MTELFTVRRTFPSASRIVRGQVIEAEPDSVASLVRNGYLVPVAQAPAPEPEPEPSAEVVAKPKRKKKAADADAETAGE